MNKITYSEVNRRRLSLMSEMDTSVRDSAALYLESANKHPEQIVYIRNFVNECAKDHNVASYYFEELQQFTENNYDDNGIRYTFESKILPIISLNPRDMILEGHSWENTLRRGQVCDRIAENMALIEKKIPIDEMMRSHQVNSPYAVADLCCEAVRKYKMSADAKINIALEQAVMLMQKHDMKFSESAICSRIIDNFFIMDELDESSPVLNDISMSLINSPVIDYNHDAVEYQHTKLIEDFYYRDREWEKLHEIVEEVVNSLGPNKSMRRVHGLFNLTQTCMKSPDSDLVACVFGAIESIPDKFLAKFETIPSCSKVAYALEAELDGYVTVAKQYARFPAVTEDATEIMQQRYNELADEFQYVKECIHDIQDLIYTKENVEAIQEISVFGSKGVISLSNAMDKLASIGNNILKSQKWIKGKAHVQSVGKETTTTLKTAGSNGKLLKLLKKNNVPDLKEANIYDYLTPDGRIDAIVERFVLENGESVDSTVHELFGNICNSINSSVLFTGSTGDRCYYIASDNIVEVHYCDHDRVQLTEEEADLVVNSLDEAYDAPLIWEMIQYSVLSEEAVPTKADIEEFIIKQEAALNENFDTFLELASYAAIDPDLLKEAFEEASKFTDPGFKTKGRYRLKSYTPIVSSPEIMMEAMDFFGDLIQEKVNYDEKYKDTIEDNDKEEEELDEKKATVKAAKNSVKTSKDKKKEKEDKKKKEPKEVKPISFNNVKLFLMGLNKKMKDLGSKEQGFCRTLDSNFNRCVKAMKSALISDRREAIIKGSVIPSFSKSIKTGILLAGTAVINPLAPIITAIGAFALSKNLTKKERTLLLDDIEIELKVIDKEIQMAESKDETKKMRALMKEQRNLQRQYQRIKYNIRVGQDLIPGGKGD